MSVMDLLIKNMTEAGCEVHRASGAVAAAGIMSEATGSRQALMAASPLVERVWEHLEWEAVSFSRAPEAPLGLFEADAAVAETGSLLSFDTSVDIRLASTLPLEVFALVSSRRVLETLSQAVDGSDSPLRALITGPSSTGDIENVHQVGVHGPHRLVVIMVDEEEAN